MFRESCPELIKFIRTVKGDITSFIGSAFYFGTLVEQVYRIEGGATNKAVQALCFLWERGAL